jgi:hypothetical protein
MGVSERSLEPAFSDRVRQRSNAYLVREDYLNRDILKMKKSQMLSGGRNSG